MASDALVALGVVVAGLVILWTGWLWLDPAVSIAISVRHFGSAPGRCCGDATRFALDAVPPGIDQRKVTDFLRGLPGRR